MSPLEESLFKANNSLWFAVSDMRQALKHSSPLLSILLRDSLEQLVKIQQRQQLIYDEFVEENKNVIEENDEVSEESHNVSEENNDVTVEEVSQDPL